MPPLPPPGSRAPAQRPWNGYFDKVKDTSPLQQVRGKILMTTMLWHRQRVLTFYDCPLYIVYCVMFSCTCVFTFYCYVMHCCTVYGQSVEGLHGLRHDQTLKSEVFLTNSKGIRAPLAPACPPPGKGQGGSCPPCPRGVGVPAHWALRGFWDTSAFKLMTLGSLEENIVLIWWCLYTYLCAFTLLYVYSHNICSPSDFLLQTEELYEALLPICGCL